MDDLQGFVLLDQEMNVTLWSVFNCEQLLINKKPLISKSEQQA